MCCDSLTSEDSLTAVAAHDAQCKPCKSLAGCMFNRMLHSNKVLTQVSLLVGWLVGLMVRQQDYTKNIERISTKLRPE